MTRDGQFYCGTIVPDERQTENEPIMRLARELIRYLGASAAALALDVSLLWLQVSIIGVPSLAAAAISFLSGTAFVYWASVSRIFGFRRLESARNEFAAFLAVGLVGLTDRPRRGRRPIPGQGRGSPTRAGAALVEDARSARRATSTFREVASNVRIMDGHVPGSR